MPRFVLLRHETPPGHERGPHWDLMLQSGDVLFTWALTELPRDDHPVAAIRLPDHRPFYLDYEGPLSDNRGHVARHDQGEYRVVNESPEEMAIYIEGRLLQGEWMIRRDVATGDDTIARA